ncbi:uncharacterized protein EHS24_001684 [Apiotrichum porosum]|uniref:Uncharacterized protein n=1 Tax=Apiotrichum porosum TaxID=105984 RepID=A0A427XJ57_9TREE|nr:uncharacterized protein EHS24_001684 [Apiotrichum porosum]RSH78777.1 hypothetical protein EHS24_001684 [Apiotrichum porosum]
MPTNLVAAAAAFALGYEKQQVGIVKLASCGNESTAAYVSNNRTPVQEGTMSASGTAQGPTRTGDSTSPTFTSPTAKASVAVQLSLPVFGVLAMIALALMV